MASAFETYLKEDHNIYQTLLKDDQQRQDAMTPDIPGASDGSTGVLGELSMR
jgi:hypothetical protein